MRKVKLPLSEKETHLIVLFPVVTGNIGSIEHTDMHVLNISKIKHSQLLRLLHIDFEQKKLGRYSKIFGQIC